MTLRGCSSSHFIWSIKDGVLKKVHNMDLLGRPSLKFKKLEEIYQHADAEYTPMPLAERETVERNGYGVEENRPVFPSKENSLEELTLAQMKKKLNRKKRKALESVLLTPKVEDDFDLTEPLCNFRVKVSKSSRSIRVSANGNHPTSSGGAQVVTSELSKDLAAVSIKVEAPELEYFESNHYPKRGESESSTNEGEKHNFNEVPEVEFFESNHDPKRGESESFTNEGEKCEFNEVSEVEYFESNHDSKRRGEPESFTNEGEKCEFNEASEVEYFESNHDLKRGESESLTNEGEKHNFNEVPEVEFFESNHDPKRGEPESFTNEGGKCEFNEVSEVEYFESNHDSKRGESESFTNEGEKHYFNEVPKVELFECDHDPKRGESESFTNEGEKCEFNVVPEVEYFEINHDLKRGESESFTNEGEKHDSNEVPEVELFESNHDPKREESESFTNEGEKCEFNEVSEVEYFESNHDSKRGESESFTNEGEKCEFNEVSEVGYFASNHDSKRGESESFTNEGEKHDFNEVPEVEPFESNHDPKRGESASFTNEGEKCEFNEVPEVEFFESNHDPNRGKSESFTNEGGKCEFNEVLFDSVDDIKNMEIDNEETVATVNQSPSVLSSLASDCCQSQLYLQQTSDQPIYISAVQDSDPTIDDEHDEDVVSMETTTPISEENKNLTSMNIDEDSSSFNSDDISLVSKDVSISQELLSTVPAITGSEVKLDHNDQTCVMTEASEIRQPERHPLTRKFISPNSQEKLCQAMKSAESSDDMEHFKCKEKLYFGEQSENKISSTKSDDEDNKLSAHPQQATQFIQNKALISSKHVLKRPRNYKKVSPTKKGIAVKGCLDGSRLCRSLPRLSTGCTSIEGCSESAIAFSQRQMHDIESLASKLMSELNSMRVIVEEKMLYEAYRSTSLKNEAVEVKSAIKSATKTAETAKKWLSMMARDCTRFCKIMKLNEDNSTSASIDPASGNTYQEKPIEREKKKISFADETGGTLCDIKVYQIEQEPSKA
ncbi:hypothetical protein L1987_64495 [Smallanthus sonchifolius]|uniref:Uncharacterized protein n=1 Tax=Smallanthus sonchifolius TaxID=185202 RepID=A0ACB9CG98_9ASTR|nr:hypothetical protein L1987_64495 [Smallanthus sonchifolius]